MSTPENVNRILAQRIASALLTNGDKIKHDRLAMKRKDDCGVERDGGGWCERALVDEILKVLNAGKK